MLWNISKLEALFNFYRNTLNLTKKEEGGELNHSYSHIRLYMCDNNNTKSWTKKMIEERIVSSFHRTQVEY